MNELVSTITATDADTAEVTFTRHHDTDPADLWDAVTSPERIARWFAPVTGELRDGGEFVIEFEDEHTPACRVVACDAPRSYAWEWHHDSGSSHISVEVSPDGDGSRLLLVHTRLDRASAPEYGAGWHAHLESLEAMLTGSGTGDWWERFASLKADYAARLTGLPQGA